MTYAPIDRWTTLLTSWPGAHVVIGAALVGWFGRSVLYRMWLWGRGKHVNDVAP